MAAVHDQRQPSPVEGTAVALRDPLPWDGFAELARDAESRGYRAVFLPEIAGRDAFAALAALAGETSSLLLGTGIVPMTSRVPRLTAMGAATVHERSGGRAILGLGTGPARTGALDALTAQVQQIRGLLGGAPAPLGDEDPEPLSLRLPSAIPVWIAALGPRSMRLAGRIGDGVLLNWCSPERVAQARLDVRAAAEDAGRDPDAVTIAVYVRSCVDQDDDAAALRAAKAAAGEYASYPAYARQFDLMGLGAQAEAAAAAHRAGSPEDVPDGLVHAVCLVGGAADVRERLDAYRDAGAHLPVVYPMLVPGQDAPASISATIRGLAPAAG
jgi:5,10-methylenetetrahydromethanopterin reductase